MRISDARKLILSAVLGALFAAGSLLCCYADEAVTTSGTAAKSAAVSEGYVPAARVAEVQTGPGAASGAAREAETEVFLSPAAEKKAGRAADGNTDPGSPVVDSPEYDSHVYIENADQTPDTGIGAEFSYGFRNTAKTGRRLPFILDISNYYPEDIKGTLVIMAAEDVPADSDDAAAKLSGYADTRVRYTYEVSVPARDRFRLQDRITISENVRALRIELLDNDGKELFSRLQPVSISGEKSELLIGIMSDSPDRLAYLRGISISGSGIRTRVVELDPEDIRERGDGIGQIDVIVISGLNEERLDKETVDSIRAWVSDGGVLLIGSGENAGAAQVFGEYIEDFSIGAQHAEDVNMGLKYSKTGPDGATVSLIIRDIITEGGIQVMQSDDIAMLTTVNSSNGITGFTAYDLCDISEFCAQEVEYADDMLQSLLGSARIERYSRDPYGSMDMLGYFKSFLGRTDFNRLPNITLYAAAAAVYLICAVWGMYFWLRNRNLGIYYHAFVIIAAFASAFMVWLLGAGRRVSGTVLEYAAIREVDDGSVRDSGFIRLSKPVGGSLSLTFPEGMETEPVIINDALRADAGVLKAAGKSLFPAKRSIPEVTIHRGEAESLTATGLIPFEGMALEYTSSPADISAGDIRADLQFFNEELTGSIVNNSRYDIENAALLFEGRVARLGRLAAGSTVELEGTKLLNCSSGLQSNTAAYISGMNDHAPGSAAYSVSASRRGLLAYYMEEELNTRYSGARLFGFIPDKTALPLPEAVEGSSIAAAGDTLIVCREDISFTKGRGIWRNGLATDPALISGDYDAATNMTKNSAVLEYNLGNDININSLYFSFPSQEFATDKMRVFEGSISLYNYQTGNYENIKDRREFNAAQIRSYLSPSNTIIIRYMTDEPAAGNTMMLLPSVSVTGVER